MTEERLEDVRKGFLNRLLEVCSPYAENIVRLYVKENQLCLRPNFEINFSILGS